MRAPERIQTTRLRLRAPGPADAEAVFTRYASDPEVTRFLGWPRHDSVARTRAFLEWSEAEWARAGAGPYLIESSDGRLLGGTGLGLETPFRAATGYVLARDAWGLGYATEALRAMVALASALRIERLQALCHPEHAASRHVLEKCGFTREGLLRRHSEFPNLEPGRASDAYCYVRLFDPEPLP
jgi:RimJ/RimL family protein N-acetyltransferase